MTLKKYIATLFSAAGALALILPIFIYFLVCESVMKLLFMDQVLKFRFATALQKNFNISSG